MWQDHPQPPLVPCYDNPKEGSANLGNLFTKQKIPTHSQSANFPQANCDQQSEGFRGAVRPPFIEAMVSECATDGLPRFGGQSAPPSLKQDVIFG